MNGETMNSIIIEKEDINSAEAGKLIDELSDELCNITGNSGRSSFHNSDIVNQRSIFVVAKKDGKAVGCGAFREISEDTAEIKRMYTRIKSQGIGKSILKYLEAKAKEYGYSRIVLETRICNENAVKFYQNNNYRQINNYGKYENRLEAICFEKMI
jgi:N-acetylglutamate synthase-like GNAT family acetyltransferase